MNFKRKIIFSYYRLLKTMNHFKPKEANVITFHSVNPNISQKSSVIYIRPEDFEELIIIFKNQYNVISLTKLVEKITQKDELDPRTIVITFDDGYLDNYEYAAPILKKYNLPACFFITSGFINTNKNYEWNHDYKNKIFNMNWRQVKELNQEGFEIGSHTVNHVNLGQIDLKTAKNELEKSKNQIEDQLGKEVNLFAYPFGGKNNINEKVRDIVKNVGYKCCCSAFGGKVTRETNPFRIERISNYPTTIETLMELDGFMTFNDGKMKFNLI